jgi:hypothetical protein
MLLPNSLYHNHKKALVLGTGGGNDIVSALIVALDLQKHGLEVGLAGVNSPAAIHTYGGELEQPVNRIVPNTRRYIPAKISREISYVDAHLPELLEKHDMQIDALYDLSVRFGTEKLTEGMRALIAQEQYDLLVAVDVGGDILARGAQDAEILSPQMDLTSLHLLEKVGIPSVLIEMGYGTDGELRQEGM